MSYYCHFRYLIRCYTVNGKLESEVFHDELWDNGLILPLKETGRRLDCAKESLDCIDWSEEMKYIHNFDENLKDENYEEYFEVVGEFWQEFFRCNWEYSNEWDYDYEFKNVEYQKVTLKNIQEYTGES